ncbi:integrase [Cryobacterium zongtaii]|uniref:Integrase n=1 Tax=Cryobacterium zongtaii TaxID=1259217 RepID=A0A2S3ZDV8_9MICO|nr:integrase [Cryobacterium zongtaii]
MRAMPVAPYWEVVDAGSGAVPCVERYLYDFWAKGMSTSSVESYARDLLRWFRFLWDSGRQWDRATRDDVRDFVVAMREATKQPATARPRFPEVNEVSGKPNLASTYAPRTINHNLSVISAFYEYHRRALTGPLRNPVPERGVNGSRFGAHHNPEDEYVHGRRADYRQKVPVQAARSIPDLAFENLFSALGSDRDRALVAFYVSSAARPSELVGLTNGMVDVGNQCISVVRKGSGSIQRVPASSEAFMWFRLYQDRLPNELSGSGLSAWWTRRRPYRPMNYEAVRAVIRRLNVGLGSNWTLHDFRHTAAMRMAQDPRVSITDIQAVLGHVHLSTTEAYLKPRDSEVIGRVNEHLAARLVVASAEALGPTGPSRYSAEDIDDLFGGAPWQS